MSAPSQSTTPPAFADLRAQEAARALERLRHLVRASGRTQRSIEVENGFQRGYLSQVLKGNITLTVRHLLGILGSLDVKASSFFGRLEEGDGSSAPPAGLLEIRERMARYDAAFEQLAERGLLEAPLAGDSKKQD